MEKIFKALSNLSRLKIVQFLKGKKEASVTEISSATGCSYKATSKHLSILFRTDILDREQRFYEMHYKLSKNMGPIAKSLIKIIS